MFKKLTVLGLFLMMSVSVHSVDQRTQERFARYEKLNRVMADHSQVRAVGNTITTTDLVAGFGKPPLFEIECDPVLYDPAKGAYVPSPDGSLFRTETWIYSNIHFDTFEGPVVVGAVNGEVVSVDDYSGEIPAYENAGVDPRKIGCDQPREELDTYLPGTLVHTTVGSAAESQLVFGNAQVEMEYFQTPVGTYLAAIYVNGKMRSLSTQ